MLDKMGDRVFPGVYKQVQSLGLGTVVCKCNCPVFAAGMNTDEGYIVLTCVSCGNYTTKLWPATGENASLNKDNSYGLEPADRKN